MLSEITFISLKINATLSQIKFTYFYHYTIILSNDEPHLISPFKPHLNHEHLMDITNHFVTTIAIKFTIII